MKPYTSLNQKLAGQIFKWGSQYRHNGRGRMAFLW